MCVRSISNLHYYKQNLVAYCCVMMKYFLIFYYVFINYIIYFLLNFYFYIYILAMLLLLSLFIFFFDKYQFSVKIYASIVNNASQEPIIFVRGHVSQFSNFEP